MRIGHKYKKEENLADCPLPHIWVIRLGLEPKTPTLKEVAAPKRQKASPMARFLTQPAKLANLAILFKRTAER